ncbi:hypothetical protein BerOc1_00265 [Pseudodesulfovibrio hydrargyri]|uniref:Type VI secretion system spike protein VgrG3-like C-terminal domain-containing protein n=1 Tax=Pseudodesulfovibrio hydrargyri TaxID=2125990 RepID=A0A1J5N849_9BACT|nr:hypothetical protein [Pseudodesulfovibrio hydrargyri]OIQ51803.1 hypothetical protein BerOc1_00265 [Pseudodesulfovibrio hydrargyri]
MSIGKIGGYDIPKAAQNAPAARDGERLAMKAAFDNQMSMAQALFGNGADKSGEGGGGFDVSIINDSQMLEALSALSRIMRDEAGLKAPLVRPRTDAQPAADISRPATNAHTPGALAARFESGEAGVAAVGYDRVGGTSYGKYQIASKPGTMDEFLSYLDENRPEWADRLRDAGPADTGSKQGGMPSVWQAIATEDPAGFEQVQHDFIARQTYDPARNMILDRTGLDFNSAPPALQEVLWSTSVQHGPTGAANIFNKVIDRFLHKGQNDDFNAQLIKGVYESRKNQFGSSSARVQKSVAHRMDSEKQLALNMLEKMSVNRMV